MNRVLHILLALVACAPPDADDDADASSSSAGAGGGELDEAAVVARAMSYASELVQINAEPRASQHGLAATVNMWVAPEIAELYRSLDPNTTGPLVEFPDGALAVKEHLDESGVAVGYTIVAKGDPASHSGGWWWGRVDGGGVLREHGEVGFCVACHAAVESEGWLFGVPLDNRR